MRGYAFPAGWPEFLPGLQVPARQLAPGALRGRGRCRAEAGGQARARARACKPNRLHRCLGYAVRKKRLTTNPLSKANLPEGWTAPQAPDETLDPRAVGSPALVASMLEACGTVGKRQGPRFTMTRAAYGPPWAAYGRRIRPMATSGGMTCPGMKSM
jgi:hypothetical protein